MVRINLIHPKYLSDQHLIAEYNEILMLIGHVKKFPHLKNIPNNFCLGKGHIIFFKNKLGYLKDRHERVKIEMRRRGFVTSKDLDVEGYDKVYFVKYLPSEEDKKIIRKRIIEKINKKPDYYRYYGKKKWKKFFLEMIENAK